MHGTEVGPARLRHERLPKSVGVDFGCSLPSFETRPSGAPQDEAEIFFSQTLPHRDVARVVAGGVGLRRIFRMIAARTIEARPQLFAHPRDPLCRRLRALLHRL